MKELDTFLPTPVAVDAIAGSPERPSRADRAVDLPTVAHRIHRRGETEGQLDLFD